MKVLRTGAFAAITASLMAFGALGAEPCEHAADASSAGAPAPRVARGSAVEARGHQHDAAAPTITRGMTFSSHGCCDGAGATTPPCPSCPTDGVCTAQSSVTAIVDEAGITVLAPTDEPSRRPTGRCPDSWSRSLDTPPPKG